MLADAFTSLLAIAALAGGLWWGWTWLDRLIQDLNYGARILARSPGFTIMVVLVLAIGISVNVSAFSLFDMVALKALPVRDPGSIVRLERRARNAERALRNLSQKLVRAQEEERR